MRAFLGGKNNAYLLLIRDRDRDRDYDTERKQRLRCRLRWWVRYEPHSHGHAHAHAHGVFFIVYSLLLQLYFFFNCRVLFLSIHSSVWYSLYTGHRLWFLINYSSSFLIAWLMNIALTRSGSLSKTFLSKAQGRLQHLKKLQGKWKTNDPLFG